jgi:hypothetical protein
VERTINLGGTPFDSSLVTLQLGYDMAYRREWCENAGLGFELGELGYKLEVPIRPVTRCVSLS